MAAIPRNAGTGSPSEPEEGDRDKGARHKRQFESGLWWRVRVLFQSWLEILEMVGAVKGILHCGCVRSAWVAA